jgi:hypothetical protein
MDLVNLRVDSGYVLVKPDKDPVEQNGVDVVKSHNGGRQYGLGLEGSILEGEAPTSRWKTDNRQIFKTFEMLGIRNDNSGKWEKPRGMRRVRK